MVVVPGGEGDLGVLPRHAPAITTVRTGTIVVYEDGAESDRIFIAGGFAEVTPERCTILAEEAVPVADIDKAEIESDLADLRDDLSVAEDDAERSAVEAAIAIAEAKIDAVDNPVYP